MKLLTITLISAMLFISVFSILETDSVRASGPLPTADEQKAYAHYSEDDQLWMNSLETDTESVQSHFDRHINVEDTDWTYGFPLRQGPNDNVTLVEPLTLDTSIKASGWFGIQFDTGPFTPNPSNVAIRLVSEGNIIGEDTNPTYSDNAESYQFNITLNQETVNDLTLQITFIEHAGTTNINIDLEGGIFVTLPIVPSASGDDDTGDDDDTSDDDTSDDDSDDDTSDDDADDTTGNGNGASEEKEGFVGSIWMWIAIAAVIIIVIGIIAFVLWKKSD